MMPLSSAIPMPNASTRRLNCGCTNVGNATGLAAMSDGSDIRAIAMPASAPSIASTQFSVTSCRSNRPGPAPSAVRTAISRCRALDRPIKQTRDVRAGNQQHQGDGRHESDDDGSELL